MRARGSAPPSPGSLHSSSPPGRRTMIDPVGPVGFVAWQGIQRRWASLLLLTLVLGLTGAVVLAGLAGSRRGRSTLDEFLEYHRPGVVEAFVDPSLPVVRQEALLAEMVEASGSADTFVSLASVVVALPGPQGVTGPGTDITVADAYLAGVPMRDVQRALVIDGRLPLADGEVALNERLAARRGVTVGDEVDLALFAPEDLNRVGNGETAEATEIVATTVGAIVRTPLDLARSPQAQPGTLFEADEGRVVLEPTFWEHHGRAAAAYGMGTIGLLAPDELAPAVAAMRAVGGDRVLVTTAGSEDLAKIEPVGDAIDLESNAVLALALVVLVFGLAVLGTALARATGEDAVDRQTFGTLGLTRRQITASILLRGGLLTALATVIAVAVAVPASSFFPIGLAGDAEIHPGVEVDGLVLLAGGVLFFLLVMARIVLGAWADRRPADPPSGGALSSLPVTPAALGARRVLAGLGRGGATGRLALVTAMVGVAAVSGAATFATSLGGWWTPRSARGGPGTSWSATTRTRRRRTSGRRRSRPTPTSARSPPTSGRPSRSTVRSSPWPSSSQTASTGSPSSSRVGLPSAPTRWPSVGGRCRSWARRSATRWRSAGPP